jgi:hypothetical protein
MFVLLICVYLYRRQCSWSSINSGSPGTQGQKNGRTGVGELRTRY